MGAADSHAGNFMTNRMKQIREVRERTNIDLIVISPFDAELFGHWWFEAGVPEFVHPQIGVRPAPRNSSSPRPPITRTGTTRSRWWCHRPRAGGTRDTGRCGSMKATAGSTARTCNMAAKRMTRKSRGEPRQQDPSWCVERAMRCSLRASCAAGAVERLGVPDENGDGDSLRYQAQ